MLASPERPTRLLVVKLADFGDALLATPALSALREALPDACIDVLTTAAGASVFRHTGGLVDKTIVFDTRSFVRTVPRPAGLFEAIRLARSLRASRYDAVLSMHSLVTRRGVAKHAALAFASGAKERIGLAAPGSSRGWFLTQRAADAGYDAAHVADSMMAVARVIAPDATGSGRPRPAVFEPGDEAHRAAEALIAEVQAGGRPIVAIHPGCGPYSPARRWPLERFAALADCLTSQGIAPIAIGGPGDGTAELVGACSSPVVDLGGRTDLATLGALLQRVAAYVGNDSGVSHLAVTMGAPSVMIFGPSNEIAWGPWAQRAPAKVVSVAVPCRPCIYVGHRLGDPKGCATRDCLRWLHVDAVFDAVREVMAGPIDRPNDFPSDHSSDQPSHHPNDHPIRASAHESRATLDITENR